MQILWDYFAHSKNNFFSKRKKNQNKKEYGSSVDYKMVKTSNTKKSLTRKKKLNDFWHYFIHQWVYKLTFGNNTKLGYMTWKHCRRFNVIHSIYKVNHFCTVRTFRFWIIVVIGQREKNPQLTEIFGKKKHPTTQCDQT